MAVVDEDGTPLSLHDTKGTRLWDTDIDGDENRTRRKDGKRRCRK